jgi:lysophospholipase L1-like esterase
MRAVQERVETQERAVRRAELYAKAVATWEAALIKTQLPDVVLTEILDEINAKRRIIRPAGFILCQDGMFKEVAPLHLPVLFRGLMDEKCYETFFPGGKHYKLRQFLPGKRRMDIRIIEVFGGYRQHEAYIQKAILCFLHHNKKRHPENPNVLVVGDSIRMRYLGRGYGACLYDLMKDNFNFIHIPHNCSNSRIVRKHIISWLRSKPRIILMNAGLHDVVKREPGTGAKFSISPGAYRANLQFAIDQCNKAKILVLMTSTPVREHFHNDPGKQRKRLKRGASYHFRYNKDIEAYNEIMKDIAAKNGLDVIDLFAAIDSKGPEKCIEEDGVHLTRFGENVCAREIEKYLIALGDTLK